MTPYADDEFEEIIGSKIIRDNSLEKMNKIKNVFKSRTFWSAVVLFLVSGVEGVKDLIPEVALLPVQGFLTLLVGYFRVNPRV